MWKWLLGGVVMFYLITGAERLIRHETHCAQHLEEQLRLLQPLSNATVERCDPSGTEGRQIICFVRMLSDTGAYRTKPYLAECDAFGDLRTSSEYSGN